MARASSSAQPSGVVSAATAATTERQSQDGTSSGCLDSCVARLPRMLRPSRSTAAPGSVHGVQRRADAVWAMKEVDRDVLRHRGDAVWTMKEESTGQSGTAGETDPGWNGWNCAIPSEHEVFPRKRQHSASASPYRVAVPVSGSLPFGSQVPSPALTALFQFVWAERRSLHVASPAIVSTIGQLMEGLQAEDLGISSRDVAAVTGRSGIGYQDVYSGPDMTICIFMLRAGAVIPLHDHPNMHVFGRLLFGRMRVRSFDPDPQPCQPHFRSRRGATLRSDKVSGPSPVSYGLGPQEGNVHELQALDDCAFFDILTPPYDSGAGRDCTYFFHEPVDPNTGRCLLVEYQPADFTTESVRYKGPPFLSVVNSTRRNPTTTMWR
eukprot:gnl/TRDRNA2_/TRDRNA2_27757_c0_seq1.p1 gnl/TRDRNA2_/TRDRNA2_27757_c0~~gnl/TRDRNA2_/TRDRNA2_27757_c0_seq1.p1  ORF type:complete len:379 (+),score=14.44 gnl/TRDRNA2_/TRDRNA2_27757_c0_seq1:57-1193(+)